MGKQLFIIDLKDKIGEQVQIPLAISKIAEHKTKNGQPFKIFTLRDKTGEVAGKAWSDYLPAVKDLSEGDVATFHGEVQKYQGKADLKITNAKVLENYEPSDFVLSSKRELAQLKQELQKRIDSVRDYQLRQLLNAFFEDEEFYQKFVQAPAAKQVHHAYQHGLLEHTLEVAAFLDPVFDIYPHLNRDLAITAVLLHDIGKVYEYKTSPSGTIDRTAEGRLLGHIQIGTSLIQEKLPEDFPQEALRQLLHIIYSHHGTGNVRSEVTPSTQEAIAVAYVDHLSGDLAIAQKSIETARKGIPEGDDPPLFTSFNRYLDTQLYLPPEAFYGEPQPNLLAPGDL